MLDDQRSTIVTIVYLKFALNTAMDSNYCLNLGFYESKLAWFFYSQLFSKHYL